VYIDFCYAKLLQIACILVIGAVTLLGRASGAMISTERSMNPNLRKKEIPVFTWANLAPPYLEHAYFEDHDLQPFQADAASFHSANAWWLAEASTLAYADEAFAVEWFKKAGMDTVRFFEKNSTQCFVASNREFVVVAFRGSEVWKRKGKTDIRVVAADFMTNADFWLADWPRGGKVHRGFKNALDEIWEELFAYLKELERDGRKIWMTGHSLGAALATLAADRYGEVQGVYTFGSPRVGNLRFKESYSNRAYRLVNGSDIVTKVPPSGFYVHVGELRFIDREGGIFSQPADKISDPPPGGVKVGRTGSFETKNQDKAPVLVPDAVLDHVPLLYAILIWNHLVGAD
jgi:hypothetical protein